MGKWGNIILIPFILIIMFVAACSESKTNTSSYIKITEKGTTGKQYWATAIDPNSLQQQKFILTIDNMNTWNLIEESKEYFATYEYTSLDKGADLLSMRHPAIPK